MGNAEELVALVEAFTLEPETTFPIKKSNMLPTLPQISQC